MGSKKEVTVGKKFGDWTVLEIEVKNPNSKAKRVRKGALCECKCGKQQYIEYRALYDGRTTNCGCEWHKQAGQKRMLNNIIPIGTQFGKLTVIGDAGMDKYNKHFSICQCECGTILNVANTHLKNGHTRSCGCQTESFGSQKIKKLLQNNNINFITEYTFSDLLSPNGWPLRFDFAIFKDQQLYELIEFDGPQHYNSYSGYYEGKLEQIQQYDEIKNQYCKEHNIKLIRVSYKEENNITLELLELNNYMGR